MELAAAQIEDVVERALREDLADFGDRTTRLALGGLTSVSRATIYAKASGVIAGLDVAEQAFRSRDPEARFERPAGDDGCRAEPGVPVLVMTARTRALLEAERTALNFMQRLSGIATLTRRYVDAVEGTGASVLDTRKTTPMLRAFEKYAVKIGGGVNHRFGLFDQVLLKENHFAGAEGSYQDVVARAVESKDAGSMPVIAEARDIDEACAAVRGGAGIVMLDNFVVPEGLTAGVRAVRAAAKAAGSSVQIEASGGVTLETIRSVADCGVDRISVGALTHSAGCLDLSMLFEESETS